MDHETADRIATSLIWLVALTALIAACVSVITASMIYNFIISRTSYGGAKAQAIYRKATLLLTEEKPEAAVELMRHRIASHPNDAFAYFMLGQAYHMMKRASECSAAMKKASELNPILQERIKPYLETAPSVT
jgi:cytochrome c-type biogenesis protein CcmH/NrfG